MENPSPGRDSQTAPLTVCSRASLNTFTFTNSRLRQRNTAQIREARLGHVNRSAASAQGFGVGSEDLSLRWTEADFCLS